MPTNAAQLTGASTMKHADAQGASLITTVDRRAGRITLASSNTSDKLSPGDSRRSRRHFIIPQEFYQDRAQTVTKSLNAIVPLAASDQSSVATVAVQAGANAPSIWASRALRRGWAELSCRCVVAT